MSASAGLLRELGCGACHAGVPEPNLVRRRAPALGAAGREYDPGFLFRYLQDPGRIREDIGRSRMPDFHLDEAESAALTLYLMKARGSPLQEEDGPRALRRLRRRPAVSADRGRAIYAALNCAGCHRGPGVEAWKSGPDLSREATRGKAGWLAGWLQEPRAIRPYGDRPGTGSRMPDFGLTRAAAESLAAVLTAGRTEGGRAAGEKGAGGAPREALRPAELSPYERRKARALLRRRYPCLGCHRLGDRGGRVGPTFRGLSKRRPAGYVLGMIRRPASHAPRTVMPRVPMDRETRRLLASYLLARSPETEPPPGGRARSGYLSLVDHPIRPPEPHERTPSRGAAGRDGTGSARPVGASLYRSRCAACHGARGQGDGYNARYLPVRPTIHAAGGYMSTRTDATLFDGIYAGGRVLNRSHFMPPFGQSLDRDQLWSLVSHVRELCDCREPEWARDDGSSAR